MNRKNRLQAAAAAAALCLVLGACASIGRPEGGRRDTVPPVYVRSVPSAGAVNVQSAKIDAWFDENIQLDDAFNKVIVSPTQKTPPTVRSLGKHLSVELRDTLLPNTTYTIDFGDAVRDLNEGNILDGFALDFSTGPEIDTLRISGMVLQAENLEPAQGMTVGIYAGPADTALATMPFERIARTNQYGQFTVRNLKPGRYAVYAFNDQNRDHRWDITEDIAFIDSLVTPSAQAITVSDTLRDALGNDSVVTRAGTAYLPADILLTWFNHNRKPQYLQDYKRPERRLLTIQMGAPADSLPQIKFAGGPLDGQNLLDHALLQRNVTKDTLQYWLRTPRALAIDSMLLAVRHRNTDTLQNLTWKTDTLKFFFKDPKKPEKKKKDKDAEQKPPPTPVLSAAFATPQAHPIFKPLLFRAETPIGAIDTAGIHLETEQDTLWIPVKGFEIQADTLNPLMWRKMTFDQTPGQKYRVTIDSAAVADIYGVPNKTIRHEFTVRAEQEYAHLTFSLAGADTTAMVVLLNASDKPVDNARADARGRADFRYVTPGTYYARMFFDRNGNGVWDGGDLAAGRQPEEVYYYPKKLDLRANWDIEQPWDVTQLALDMQKPAAIKANKPRTAQGQDTRDDDTEYDEWGDPVYRDANGNIRPAMPGNQPLRGPGGLQQQSGNQGTLRR